MSAPRKPRRRPASATPETWVCGHCGAEGRCPHPREDRVPLGGMGPRGWIDEFSDARQPRRRCACRHGETEHQHKERDRRGPGYDEAVLARGALRWDKIPDLVMPCAVPGCRCPCFRCEVCQRGPCRCKVERAPLNWARAKKRITVRKKSQDLAAAAAAAGGKEWARRLAAAVRAEEDEAAEEDDDP